jgi:hypothetical protein
MYICKTVLLIHLKLIFPVSKSTRTQPEDFGSLPGNFVVLNIVAYGSGLEHPGTDPDPGENGTDPNPQHCL